MLIDAITNFTKFLMQKMPRISKKKIVLTVLLILAIGAYFIFIHLFSTNLNSTSLKHEQEDDVIDLNKNLEKISHQLRENQLFLDELQSHFRNIINNEKIYKEEKLIKSKIKEEEELPIIKPDSKLQNNTVLIPVVVFAYNRPTVTRCLDLLFKYRSGHETNFPILVSQDGNHEGTTNAIESYSNKLTHLRHPDEKIDIPPKHRNFEGYYKISSHYKWGISETFRRFPTADALIIMEDDLDIAPDFFGYFFATHSLLLRDPTLYCVSAWNDNGKENLIDEKATSLLYRSDFFPGLGWMLSRSIWKEVGPNWPPSFWDDWFRLPPQRRERACIRPEIGRTRTFGRIGVSKGQFFDSYLKFIKLNDQYLDWNQIDVSHLEKEEYDNFFLEKVYRLPVVSIGDLNDQTAVDTVVRLEYNSIASFKRFAKVLGIMNDFKSGVPRTAYKGIVSIFYKNRRVYIAPKQPWAGYDEK